MALLKLLALIFTVLALLPSAAHLFALPGKIGLARDAYFTVQAIYSGWSLFGIPIFAAILCNIALALAHWRLRDRRGLFAGLSALLIAGSLGVFFTWVFPGNVQTANWTEQTENWELLRRNWEYGHAASAVIVFAAFIATCLASVESFARSSAKGTPR